MKKDDAPSSDVQSLHAARTGPRETLGGWLRARLGRPSLESLLEAHRASALLPVKPHDVPAPAGEQPIAPAAEAVRPVGPEPRRVSIVAAPHPASRRLFADMLELVALREDAGPAVMLQLATSPEEAAALPRDLEIYLRSECSTACRIVAAVGAREAAQIGAATWLLTWLEHNYWQCTTTLIVEAALRDPPYLLARLGELLGLSFGPAAGRRAAELFAARAREADSFCDPFGYMAALEVGTTRGAMGPEPAGSAPTEPADEGGLLAAVMRLHASEGVLVVAPDSEAAREALSSGIAAAAGARASSVEAALEAAPAGPRLACLIGMADHPHLPELVDALQGRRWVLCGREGSLEAVGRLCARCLDAGVGHQMNFLFEGADWKAYSFWRWGA